MHVLDKNGIWRGQCDGQISYPTSGNSNCLQVEEQSFWFKHRNRVLGEILARFPFHGNFADIGGGNGFQIGYLKTILPKATFFLIEPGYEGCLSARERGLDNVYNLTFQNFDFSKHEIGAVGLFDVLEHVNADCEFLTALNDRLPPSSLIYLTVPAYMTLWSDTDDFGGHARRYSRTALPALARKSNLELLYSTYFFSYLPLPIFFLRSLPYRFRRNRRTEDILRAESRQHIPASLSLAILDRLGSIELKLINRNSLPFGASLAAVFRTRCG